MTEMNLYFPIITLNINGLNFLNQKTKISIPSSFCTITMVTMDLLADVLKSINSVRREVNAQVLNGGCYKVIMPLLAAMMTSAYTGEFEIIDGH